MLKMTYGGNVLTEMTYIGNVLTAQNSRRGLHRKPAVPHFSRMYAFSYRIPTLGDIE